MRVTCNGCFDGLHTGHLFFLGYARGLVDQLCRERGEPVEFVVGINSDRYITDNKRPAPIPEAIRSKALLGTGIVNRVVVFADQDPINFLLEERPYAHLVGEEYRHTAVEAAMCAEQDIRLLFVPRVGEWSSTASRGSYE